MMTYSRYGKIRVKDHLNTCYFVLTFLGFGIAGFLIEYSVIYSFILLLVAILDVINIIMPYTESFEANENILITQKKECY